MKSICILVLLSLFLPCMLHAQQDDIDEEDFIALPPLPVWSEEEKQLAAVGQLKPNFFLLEDYRPGPEKAVKYFSPAPLPEDLLKSNEEPEVIPTDMIGKYFGARPESYLLDPQGLLTQQEYLDRLAFLEYHAGDSVVPIYLFVFDEFQIVPDGMQADEILNSYFQENEAVILAYYFLGNPERSQIAISNSVEQAASEGERLQLVRSCINEAVEKSDAIAQLERFSVQLSIRLFWIEKSMGVDVEGDEEAEISSARDTLVQQGGEELDELTEKLRSKKFRDLVVFAGIALFSVIAAYYARLRSLRNQEYSLPEIEVPMRFRASHAAGVGSVISFKSHTLPPSKQKEDLDIAPGIRR